MIKVDRRQMLRDEYISRIRGNISKN